MEERRPYRQDKILFVDRSHEDRDRATTALQSYFPNSDIVTQSEIEAIAPEQNKFDIVVLDQELGSTDQIVELLFRLKTADHDPSVVVIAKSPNASLVTELYKFGCHRCIVKDEHWIQELGTAVDYLMRLRKVASENLVLRARLTEANAALMDRNARLDEFTATIAHDIRGPLGGISMKLDYLIDTYSNDLDDRGKLLLERAFCSAERLTNMVQSMYEYAKLGMRLTDVKELDLVVLLEEVFHDLEFPEELDIQVSVDPVPAVWGSRDLLRRVLLNLVANAVKYCDKSPILITFGCSQRDLGIGGKFSEFFLQDNGPGIASEEAESLFTLFRRGHEHHTKTEGIGVGLAIVRRIIELHHGTIDVESAEGQGARFLFRLPTDPSGILLS